MFKQREISPRGCYEIRLFHPLKRDFVNVTIDDYIPCNAAGRPMYSQPHNNELVRIDCAFCGTSLCLNARAQLSRVLLFFNIIL